MSEYRPGADDAGLATSIIVVLAGFLALAGGLMAAAGVALMALVLVDALGLDGSGSIASHGSMTAYWTAMLVIFLTLVGFAVHNAMIAFKWRTFLAVRWKRYLINSALSLILFGLILQARHVI